MEKEVEPAVLALMNEKRLLGDKLTPVEIIARLGVLDARKEASAHAWLATGDNVVVTLWAEFVGVAASGRWFYLESLDTHRQFGGGERSPLQIQRAKDRLDLLKFSLDAGQPVRAVLQTNRIDIAALETDKTSKVSVRVADDEEWHIADWNPDSKMAVLVRGARGWLPTADDLKSAMARGSIPKPLQPKGAARATPEEVHAAAVEYLTGHFKSYGYRAENVNSQHFGYDLEVSDKKGTTLLKLAVKGLGAGINSFRLTDPEKSAAGDGDPWRLAVVTDTLHPGVQHKIYKPSEVESASGLEPEL